MSFFDDAFFDEAFFDTVAPPPPPPPKPTNRQHQHQIKNQRRIQLYAALQQYLSVRLTYPKINSSDLIDELSNLRAFIENSKVFSEPAVLSRQEIEELKEILELDVLMEKIEEDA